MKEGNPGYLWGLSTEEPTVIGPQNKYHFRAEPGIRVPYWSLWLGPQEVGLHVFPIHEAHNWPGTLEKMLEGLNA